MYLIGKTTDGHYQIEMKCDACHTSEFGGREVLQDACVNCHGAELKRAKDAHPKSKFTDPRNADRTAILDARYCVTCHTEHQPEVTVSMGLTLQKDYCVKCHHDIAKDRPSHKDLGFDTCASAGCHNFHDNRGIYEDFLLKHRNEPENKPIAMVNALDKSRREGPLLTVADIDAPASLNYEQLFKADWSETLHAKQGVNCSGCHQIKDKLTGVKSWIKKPGFEVCRDCHKQQVAGFLDGRHGMRLKQGLSPMTPSMARDPMKDTAAHKPLGCESCHSEHRYNTTEASVTACQNCHNDEHSNAYKDSPHYTLWVKAASGQIDSKQGVSCATCHMPREIVEDSSGNRTVIVQHNQNDNLRPNEKMLRSVCIDCHGLGFSIDALADPDLVRRNFRGKPARHIESIDWAVVREKLKAKEKAKEKARIH